MCDTIGKMSFNKPSDSKNELPCVKISDFTKLRPWVLVPKGSFMGFFDWVRYVETVFNAIGVDS